MTFKNIIKKSLPLIFFSIFFISSCATNLSDSSVSLIRDKELYIPKEVVWQKIDNTGYAEYFFYENTDYPIRYHCVKINLKSPSLKIHTFPLSKNDFIKSKNKDDSYFKGLTAKEFTRKSGAQIAINTAPFDSKSSKVFSIFSSTRKICGIHIVNGEELSPPIERYSALAFKKNSAGYTGTIISKQTKETTDGYDYVFGGFFTILKDSVKSNFSWASNDSRIAVGLSEDGKILYLLAAEGENKSESVGLSYQECADIMINLGAVNAMEMDGGDSSSLIINSSNMLSHSPLRKLAVYLGFSE